MQKIPAIFKVRYGQDEKHTARSSAELVQAAAASKKRKVCALLTNAKNSDILYTSTS